MNREYLAGFFDGEGSFLIKIKKDPRYRSGYQITPKINIAQKDKKLLIEIQKFLGMGNIYIHRTDDLWHFEIYKLNDIEKFLNMIGSLLKIKKKRQRNFEQCIKMMLKKQHLSKEGCKKIKMIWLSSKLGIIPYR